MVCAFVKRVSSNVKRMHMCTSRSGSKQLLPVSSVHLTLPSAFSSLAIKTVASAGSSPTCRAMWRPVRAWSPVSITGRHAPSLMAATASALSGLSSLRKDRMPRCWLGTPWVKKSSGKRGAERG